MEQFDDIPLESFREGAKRQSRHHFPKKKNAFHGSIRRLQFQQRAIPNSTWWMASCKGVGRYTAKMA